MWFVRGRGQVLVVLAVVGCIGNLFGPDERWLGVDLGATGAAVFYLCRVGLLVLMGMRPHEVFPESWSLAERRAWVGLGVSTVIVIAFGKFLWTLSQMEIVPVRLYDLPAQRIVSFVIVLGIAWAVAAHVLGRGAGPVEQDERDLRLRYDADRAGDWALSLTVIGCVILLANVSPADIAWWLQPLVLANVLIEVMIAKLLVEHVALVALYARARG
jgi:hypothetical protein